MTEHAKHILPDDINLRASAIAGLYQALMMKYEVDSGGLFHRDEGNPYRDASPRYTKLPSSLGKKMPEGPYFLKIHLPETSGRSRGEFLRQLKADVENISPRIARMAHKTGESVSGSLQVHEAGDGAYVSLDPIFAAPKAADRSLISEDTSRRAFLGSALMLLGTGVVAHGAAINQQNDPPALATLEAWGGAATFLGGVKVGLSGPQYQGSLAAALALKENILTFSNNLAEQLGLNIQFMPDRGR